MGSFALPEEAQAASNYAASLGVIGEVYSLGKNLASALVTFEPPAASIPVRQEVHLFAKRGDRWLLHGPFTHAAHTHACTPWWSTRTIGPTRGVLGAYFVHAIQQHDDGP